MHEFRFEEKAIFQTKPKNVESFSQRFLVLSYDRLAILVGNLDR